jgi:hypothetical protein
MKLQMARSLQVEIQCDYSFYFWLLGIHRLKEKTVQIERMLSFST